MNNLILTKIQKSIFQLLIQNKYYTEIANELHLSIDEVRYKVKSVFCLAGFQEINKDILKVKSLGERLN